VGRITSATSLAGSTPPLDAAAEPAPQDTDRQTAIDRELGRLFDVLDRVERDGNRPSDSPSSAAATASGDIVEALADHLQRARLGVPPSAATTDATKLPSPAECRRSEAAIAAAGFTEVHLKPVHYFNQGENPWASSPYPRSPALTGESRTLGQAGCAPTALAMLDCGLRDSHVDPKTTAAFAVRNGVSGAPTGGGTNTAGLARAWADANGLSLTAATSSNQAKNVDALAAGLKADGIALVSVGVDHSSGQGHFATSSHVAVINGCAVRDGQEWFAVADPGRRDQSKWHAGLLGTDDTVVRIRDALNGVGQVWISRAQLEAEMKHCFVFRAGGES
jgi:hypothetical protein